MLACGGAGSEGKDADEGGASSARPSVISFSIDTLTLTEGESATISAIVSDPQGIDDLIGGELLSESGLVLATFSSSADEGAYTAEVGWDDIVGADHVTSGMGSQGRATLTGKFYDQDGNFSTADADLSLSCRGADEGICDGGCIPMDEDASNCGGCGNTCGDECRSGACFQYSDCTTETSTSCADLCAQSGDTCAEADLGYDLRKLYAEVDCTGEMGNEDTCDETWSGPDRATSLRCLCLQSD